VGAGARLPVEQGQAVQVVPIKPTLMVPGTKHLKHNTMNRLESLHSNSTCATSTRMFVSTFRSGTPRLTHGCIRSIARVKMGSSWGQAGVKLESS
jgi:hypothetical protein